MYSKDYAAFVVATIVSGIIASPISPLDAQLSPYTEPMGQKQRAQDMQCTIEEKNADDPSGWIHPPNIHAVPNSLIVRNIPKAFGKPNNLNFSSFPRAGTGSGGSAGGSTGGGSVGGTGGTGAGGSAGGGTGGGAVGGTGGALNGGFNGGFNGSNGGSAGGGTGGGSVGGTG
ncbi:unnamed protein product, partial [Fusarium langsethiae]